MSGRWSSHLHHGAQEKGYSALLAHVGGAHKEYSDHKNIYQQSTKCLVLMQMKSLYMFIYTFMYLFTCIYTFSFPLPP